MTICLRALALPLLVLGVLGGLPLLGQEPVISEFMAVNHNSLADEDGDRSDWIELYNPASQEVDLNGWYLTDDAAKLTKWQFPAVKLGPGRVLLVFASEKKRAVAGRELHTNFKLDPEGEYLGLVKPDGTTITSQFGPSYPLQIPDVAYGSPMTQTRTALLSPGATARYFVPADDSLGATWTETGFNDAAWASGPTGLGYDKKTAPTYNELIATNLETALFKVNTSIFVRAPFQVPDPSQVSVGLLRLKYEDGLVVYLNGTEVFRAGAPTTPLVWNSKAPARRAETAAIEYADVNLSSSLGLLRAGTNVLAFHGLNDTSSTTTSDYLLLPELQSIKVASADLGSRGYFSLATPGLPNDATVTPAVASEPLFSLPNATYTDPINVELQTDFPGGVIHYTTDRTEPKETSPTYAAPIAVSVTTMLRARVFAPNALPSPVASRTYLFLNPNIADLSSNLPILVVETFNKSLPEDPLTMVQVSLHENAVGRTAITDIPVFTSRAGMKRRGSSSIGFPKNNFALELWDETGRDYDAEVLGMPEESDWIMHGPYSDKTLMRNYISYNWYSQFGRYAVRCRFVELVLNQSGSKVDTGDYWGVYVFMEKIKRGDDRVDLKRLHASETSEPEITGGYILKNDRLDPGDSGVSTRRGLRLAWVEPKEKEATPAQKTYLKGFLDQFETALYGANFKDPENGYARYFDVGASIDYHILTELIKNIDGYRLSTFLFKDREGKINMGPPWDHNLSLGNADYLNGWNPQGWYYQESDIINNNQNYPWYGQLFKDPAYLAAYKARWLELRQSVIVTDKLLAQVDEIASYLDEGQQRNFNRWRTLGTYVWPNKFIGKTYAEEIAFMKGWLSDRIAWIDSTFVRAPTLSKNGGDVERGFKLEITAEDGTIYYTTNGTDPRASSGEPSADAVQYNPANGVVITANTRVMARAKAGFIWSATREATFVTDPSPLVISEIMFNPPAPPAGGAFRAIDFKFIEIQNIGPTPFSLNGVKFSKGVVFDFSTGAVASLAPGEFAVVVRNRAAFESRYGTEGIKIAGVWTQDLSDRGEAVALKGSIDETIVDFTFSDTWYPEADGQGRSIVLIDPTAPRDGMNQKTAWRPSAQVNGNPGAADTAPTGGLQLPGDISQDGALNLTDAVSLLRFLFQGLLPELPCEGGTANDPGNKALADLDGNGDVNLTDAVYVLRYLFQEGTPPALGVSCVRMTGCGDVCTQ